MCTFIDLKGADTATFGPGTATEAVEGHLVDGLERWRHAEGLGRMVLVGHSLG